MVAAVAVADGPTTATNALILNTDDVGNDGNDGGGGNGAWAAGADVVRDNNNFSDRFKNKYHIIWISCSTYSPE